MKSVSLIAAILAVAVANILALSHAWMNRTGPPDAAITVTQEELTSLPTPEANTSIDFQLRTDASDPETGASGWATRATLERLGFTYGKDAGDPEAGVYYRKQPHRPAYIALTRKADMQAHFQVVDAALDADALRGRYPDTANTIILPGVVSIEARPATPARDGNPATPAAITGLVREIPTKIHVPQPFSTAIRDSGGKFRLHLRYGRFHEPWVAGVDTVPDR